MSHPDVISSSAPRAGHPGARHRAGSRVLRTGRLFALAALAWSAISVAATTTTVVDIPAADGGTQRFLHVRPDAPIAYVVNFPGGNGNLGIRDDGSMPTRVGLCNPWGRNRAAIASRNVGLALIDTTSEGSIYQHDNLMAVVRYLRQRDDVPIWIAGGSASTDFAFYSAWRLPEDIPGGLVLISPGAPDALLSSIHRPAAVIWHPSDPAQFGAATFRMLTSARARENLLIEGGNDRGCGFHLFEGADAEFVGAAAGAIERNNAATALPAPLDMKLVAGSWFNPQTSGQGLFIEIVPSLDAMVLAWFTWGHTAGDHLWLTGLGPLTPNGATIELTRSSGGRFNDPAPVAAQSVGQAVLHFTECTRGTLRFQRSDTGESGTIPIRRLTPLPDGCPAAGSR
jgi:hypothetical protein